MEDVSLSVPDPLLDGLPDDEDAAKDMLRAVEGWESRINDAIDAAEDEREALGYVVDAIDRMEDRFEEYDGYVSELRAWGQSPIYAMTWRSLYAELIAQLYQHDWIAEGVDRERHYRWVEDGIRLKQTK
jgi:hypothetical protein